jgi:antitoxin VapB
VALSIKSAEAEQLARQISAMTGEGLTEAIANSLRERLQRLERSRQRRLSDQLDEIALRCAALPDLDLRSPDEIIGYDEHGIPR